MHLFFVGGGGNTAQDFPSLISDSFRFMNPSLNRQKKGTH